jgi:hypothetical protein
LLRREKPAAQKQPGTALITRAMRAAQQVQVRAGVAVRVCRRTPKRLHGDCAPKEQGNTTARRPNAQRNATASKRRHDDDDEQRWTGEDAKKMHGHQQKGATTVEPPLADLTFCVFHTKKKKS